jgi:hypothetical protein
MKPRHFPFAVTLVGTAFCTPRNDDAMLVALDKSTGKTLWKSQVPSGSEAAPAGPGGPPAGVAGAPGGPGRPQTPPVGDTPGANSAPGVTGTKDPDLFLSEHWGMTAFSQKIPNGEFRVTFTALVENPAIKAIEIIPQGETAAGAGSSASAVDSSSPTARTNRPGPTPSSPTANCTSAIRTCCSATT